jgi:deoxyadenosine/deoxycytidine kinase
VIDVDENKFSENPEHLGEIISRVDAEMNGLF